MSHSDDEEYIIPLQDKRVFGAGIKRKRVQFVAASDASTAAAPARASSGPSASDFYLNLVLPKEQTKAIESSENATAEDEFGETGQTPDHSNSLPKDDDSSTAVTIPVNPPAQIICETCRLPIDTSASTMPHQALLAHQLSLPHSHPPSSLSRIHPGLRILQSQGWDPDSRLGLGATGGGIRFPIKAKEKGDKMGVGATIPQPRKGDAEVSRAAQEARIKKKKEDERKKKGKGWLKKQVEQERRKGDKLKDLFYRTEEMDKYLKDEEPTNH